MRIRFVKMHGAGNDFVLVDDRGGSFPCDRRIFAAIGAHGTGVGCEGIILVQASDRVDFRMRFFNPDGSEAELCGNGARCVAAFAREIGAASSDKMCFETLAGDVQAEILHPATLQPCNSATSHLVKVWMPDPRGLCANFVNSGVPHYIVPVENLEKADVENEGRRIRYSEEFSPDGTNVDFVTYHAPNRADIRTYERGVEAETGACGTGSVAAALVGVAQYGLKFPVTVRTVKGFELVIDGEFDGKAFHSVTLTGPVARVFTGEIDLDSLDNGVSDRR